MDDDNTTPQQSDNELLAELCDVLNEADPVPTDVTATALEAANWVAGPS